jgi:GT2 family glycosyltransferase
MIKPITFCIASANNEREYTKLLLKSLKDHTQVEMHEILIFIDSDNQNTYEALLEVQKDMPMIRICKNPNDWPIGSQRNVSVMFNQASNDIVCYLQSDMVVGKDFDKHLCENLTDENTVLSCARIEPPLHPGSPEKIVKDFGIVPEEFDYDKFNEFVDELQAENRPNMIGHFAPFAIYKSTWYDKLGGFDTQFRCSREDSDMMIRMELWGLNMIQSWNACVYHFTCVSSRGKDWFKQDEEANYKNVLQQNADMQELKRFIRKWGFFGHHPKPVYDITYNIDIDQFVDMNVLKWLEPYCKRMYLTDSDVSYQLASQLDFESRYYSNLRLKYSSTRWHGVKHLFNPIDFHKKIRSSDQQNTYADAITGDVIVSFKYSELIKSKDAQQFIENVHEIVNNNEEGNFEWGPFAIQIKSKQNLMESYKRVDSIDTSFERTNL